MIQSFEYEKHGKMVREWGKKHNFPLPPKDMLPEYGIVVEDIACGFLYCTDSKIAILEWVFADPEKSKKERMDALDQLFEHMEKAAHTFGFGAILSMAGTPAYRAVLDRNGFQLSDENMSHHLKILGE